MEELVKKVVAWGHSKDLIKKENSCKQFCKVVEETAEIGTALNDDSEIDFIDAIGDTGVTLILLAAQNKIDFLDCVKKSRDEASLQMEKKDVYDIFNNVVYEIGTVGIVLDNNSLLKSCISSSFGRIELLAKEKNLQFEDCLETAYNVIAERTGKTKNGVFIKD